MRIVQWNEFINPQALAELAVFLKGYQNQCGEVRPGSLVASLHYKPHLQPSTLSGNPTEAFAQEVCPAQRCVVMLLRGVTDRLISAPQGNFSIHVFVEQPGGILYPMFSLKA